MKQSRLSVVAAALLVAVVPCLLFASCQQEPSGPQPLRYQFREGAKQQLALSRSLVTGRFDDRRSSTIIELYEIEVLEVGDEIELGFTIRRASGWIASPEGTVEFDTARSAEVPELFGPVSAAIGKQVVARVSDRGEFLSVETAQGMEPPPEAALARRQHPVFGLLIPTLPEQSVEIGDRWSQEESVPLFGFGDYRVRSHFELRDLDRGVVTLVAKQESGETDSDLVGPEVEWTVDLRTGLTEKLLKNFSCETKPAGERVTYQAVVGATPIRVSRGASAEPEEPVAEVERQWLYEVDLNYAKEQGLLTANSSESDIDLLIDQTAQSLRERLGEGVTRHGKAGILIEQGLVAAPDCLELRIVADDAYTKHGVRFDIAAERQRLFTWLAANDGANRRMVNEQPERIARFNELPAKDGGPLAGASLAWFPVLNRPSLDKPARWSRVEARPDSLDSHTPNVAAYSQADLDAGPTAEGAPEFLLEFMPINMDERHFDARDFNADELALSLDQLGHPCINYRLRDDRIEAYGDWSEEYVQQRSAVIADGEVLSAPTFMSRIDGRAQITSQAFTEARAQQLFDAMWKGALPAVLTGPPKLIEVR